MIRTKSFESESNLLYLVATPIGNMSEISERFISVLSNVDIIAAEDTRNTGSLLSKVGISKELFSLREHNENEAPLKYSLPRCGGFPAYRSHGSPR